MTGLAERFVVGAGMRNEGAFIVEWVSWYRMLGFEIVVATNDCTDRSPALLDALASAGWVHHAPHSPRADKPPLPAVYRVLHRHPVLRSADWALVCDVDEFLVLRRGDGTIGDFMARFPRDIVGMSFNWRCFGTSGNSHYAPGLVHRQFHLCAPGKNRINIQFKSIFRQPGRFARLSDHAPVGFDGTIGAPGARWVDSEGRDIPAFAGATTPVRHVPVKDLTHRNAQMNHYILRADESFDLKRGIPSPSSFNDRYTQEFYEARNRMDARDEAALIHADRFDAVHAAAMALPGVARLHHLCCADYVRRLCTHQGRAAEDDPRYRAAMAAAEAAG